MDGQPAAQGFVTALLHDKQSGRSLLVAATHLKAKAGVDNEQTRVHQVGTATTAMCACALAIHDVSYLLSTLDVVASDGVVYAPACFCTIITSH
jgi:hypothetical protein